jgi:heme oxygenase
MNNHLVIQVRMIRRLLCAKTYKRLLSGGQTLKKLATNPKFLGTEMRPFFIAVEGM